MPPLRPTVFAFLLAVSGWLGALAAEPLKPGAKLEVFPAGKVTYHDVVVRSVNARTVLITHAGGMASVHLRDLAPEWQERFGYDPAAEAAADAAAQKAADAVAAKPVVRPKPKAEDAFDALLQRFGQPATLQAEVNLRPRFAEYGLGVRDQGRRPSCSIFAVVCALEYQNARRSGHGESFSEEYLIWATRKTLQRTPASPDNPAAAPDEDADEGFSLTEVVTALRAYGIPLQTSMPSDLDRRIAAIPEPTPDVVREAREHRQVTVYSLPGRDNATRINNLIQILNAGMPVAVGMAWPNYRTLRTGYLSEQKPMTGAYHAVTIVGYRCPSGRLEDAYFIFKNSWGWSWGQGGYGTVTYSYLNRYLTEAVLLEVQPG